MQSPSRERSRYGAKVVEHYVIVANEASDLIFKIIIFHDVAHGPHLYTMGFPELAEGGGGGGGGSGFGWWVGKSELF